MSRQTVLVTGATGIVGRATVETLQERGNEVVALVRGGGRAAASRTLRVDLSTEGLDLPRLMPQAPDVVVHLAAAVPHAASVPDNVESADMTRRIDATVVGASAAWQVPMIYASGCGLYDTREAGCKIEDADLRPRSPYFEAKKVGEDRVLGLRGGCVLRISAPVGPGLRRSVVLARFIERARVGDTLEVWGKGRREQDFVAAADIALLIATIVERRAHGVFNVASGRPITMAELAGTVVTVIGDGTVRMSGRPDPHDGETARYDIGKAQTAFGWSPLVPLEESIAKLRSERFSS